MGFRRRIDQENARRGGIVTPGCEALEQRLVLSVSAALNGSTLDITITSSSTAYLQQSGSELEVDSNAAYPSPQSFTASSVSEVDVTGDSGADSLNVTGGTIAAALTTSLASTLSFTNGAAFTEPISIMLASGNLTVGGIDSTESSITITANAGTLSVTGRHHGGDERHP